MSENTTEQNETRGMEEIQKARKTPKLTEKQIEMRKTLAALRGRSATEWNELVRGIEDWAVRVKVGCIIWFDYFSTRESSERWPELDDLVNAWSPKASLFQEPEHKMVAAALVSIGFPQDMADRRTKSMDYYDETAPVEEPITVDFKMESELGERPNIHDLFNNALANVNT